MVVVDVTIRIHDAGRSVRLRGNADRALLVEKNRSGVRNQIDGTAIGVSNQIKQILRCAADVQARLPEIADDYISGGGVKG